MRIPRALLLLAACALAPACRSTPKLEPRRIPVHVAILPMAAPTIGSVAPGELEGKATELALELDCEALAGSLGEALEEFCFARTTMLSTPEEIDPFERERELLERARACGADWILELGLRYDPEIYRRNTSLFWLNYPLFLFAGPSNWFIPDNAYFADVELSARLYDLHALEALDGAPGDPAAEILATSARFTRAELTFVERSTGFGDYMKAILIPSGHLARQTDDAARKLQQAIVDELRVQTVRGIQSRREDLVRMEPIAPMFVEPGELRIERRGSDLHVRGRVQVHRGSLVQAVRAVRLEAGADAVTVEPAPDGAQGSPDWASFPFDVHVPAAAGARYLRLECRAGSRDTFVRSYTFPIPSAEEGSAM